jgi:hypothetical protein
MIEGIIEERVKFILSEKPIRTPEFEREMAYIEGLIDGLDRFGRRRTDEDIADCWKALAHCVASRESITAYFRMADVLDRMEDALTNYKTDFYKIDFRAIRRTRDLPFIWLVRDLGTHLWFVTKEELAELQKTVASFVSTWGGSVKFAGYYDPETDEFTGIDLGAFNGENLEELLPCSSS